MKPSNIANINTDTITIKREQKVEIEKLGPHSLWLSQAGGITFEDGQFVLGDDFNIENGLRVSPIDRSPSRPFAAANGTADQVRNCIVNQVAGKAGNDRYMIEDTSRMDEGIKHEDAVLGAMKDIGLGICKVSKNDPEIMVQDEKKVEKLLVKAGLSHKAKYIADKAINQEGGVLNIEDLDPVETLNFINFLIERGKAFRLTQVRLQGEGIRGFADLVEYFPPRASEPGAIHVLDVKNTGLGERNQDNEQTAKLKKIGGYGVQITAYERTLRTMLNMADKKDVLTHMGVINNESVRHYTGDNIDVGNNTKRKRVLMPLERKGEEAGRIMKTTHGDIVDMEMAAIKIVEGLEKRIRMFRLNPKSAYNRVNDPFYVKGQGPAKMSAGEKAIKLTNYLFQNISLTMTEINAYIESVDKENGSTYFAEVVAAALNPETANKTAVISAMDIKNWMRNNGHPDADSKDQNKFSVDNLTAAEIDKVWNSVSNTTKALEALNNAGGGTVIDLFNSKSSKKRIIPELAPKCGNCPKVAACTDTAKRIDSTAKIRGLKPVSVVWLMHQGIETVDQFISVCEAKINQNKVEEAVEVDLPADHEKNLDIYYKMMAIDTKTGKRKTASKLRDHKKVYGDSAISAAAINKLYMQSLASTIDPAVRAAIVAPKSTLQFNREILKRLASDKGMYAIDYEFVQATIGEHSKRWVCGDSYTSPNGAKATVAINNTDEKKVNDHYQIVGDDIVRFVKMKIDNPDCVMTCWNKGAEECVHRNVLFPGIVNAPGFSRVRLRATLSDKILTEIQKVGGMRALKTLETGFYNQLKVAAQEKNPKVKEGKVEMLTEVVAEKIPATDKETINSVISIITSMTQRDTDSIFGKLTEDPKHYEPSAEILAEAVQMWEQEKGPLNEESIIEHIRSLWQFEDLLLMGRQFSSPIMSDSIKKWEEFVGMTERKTAIKHGDEWLTKFAEAEELASRSYLSAEERETLEILTKDMEEYQAWDVTMIDDFVAQMKLAIEILIDSDNPNVETIDLPEGGDDSFDGAVMIRTDYAKESGIINGKKDLMTPKENL